MPEAARPAAVLELNRVMQSTAQCRVGQPLAACRLTWHLTFSARRERRPYQSTSIETLSLAAPLRHNPV